MVLTIKFDPFDNQAISVVDDRKGYQTKYLCQSCYQQYQHHYQQQELTRQQQREQQQRGQQKLNRPRRGVKIDIPRYSAITEMLLAADKEAAAMASCDSNCKVCLDTISSTLIKNYLIDCCSLTTTVSTQTISTQTVLIPVSYWPVIDIYVDWLDYLLHQQMQKDKQHKPHILTKEQLTLSLQLANWLEDNSYIDHVVQQIFDSWSDMMSATVYSNFQADLRELVFVRAPYDLLPDDLTSNKLFMKSWFANNRDRQVVIDRHKLYIINKPRSEGMFDFGLASSNFPDSPTLPEPSGQTDNPDNSNEPDNSDQLTTSDGSSEELDPRSFKRLRLLGNGRQLQHLYEVRQVVHFYDDDNHNLCSRGYWSTVKEELENNIDDLTLPLETVFNEVVPVGPYTIYNNDAASSLYQSRHYNNRGLQHGSQRRLVNYGHGDKVIEEIDYYDGETVGQDVSTICLVG